MEEQAELLADIVAQIQLVLPAGWQHLRLDYLAVGGHTACGGSVEMADGSMRYGTLSNEVADGFARLRDGMAHPQRGAWLQAFLALEYPNTYSVKYDRQGEPRLVPPPSAEDCRQELTLYPRDKEFLPDWMRERLAD